MTDGFRADLHCHSTCSDGTDSPLDLLRKAKQAGLSGLSITDHDTVQAYTPELLTLAQELGISLLSGVEISSEIQDATVHVLGYGFEIDSPPLLMFLQEMRVRRWERNELILRKLEKKNIHVTKKDLLSLGDGESVGRPHIGMILVQKGVVKTMKEAFDLYLKEGASCYAPGFKFTPQDAIGIIHQAKGKAVLAHPHFIKNGSLIGTLLSYPFDGLECYYSTLYPHQERSWVKIAKKKGWIATGGSDYHGACKPRIPLGCSWVGRDIFNQLKEPRKMTGLSVD